MKKEYNPCGDLTGREREICNAAVTSYYDLPFVNVMRNIVMAGISDVTENFLNAEKIVDWSKFNLNEIERQACVNFDSVEFETLTPLKVGMFKYFVHLLYENRYNIFYNRLVNFCDAENIFIDEETERILDKTAQVSDYFISFNTLIENFQWQLANGGKING